MPTGLVPPDSPAKTLTVSPASSAPTSPALLRPTTSESGDSYRSQAQTLHGQSAELDRDERRGVPHITVPVLSPRRTSSNASPLSASLSAVSPQADPTVSQTYSSGPSSPVIVVPPEVSEAGPQVSLSYLRDSNDSRGATSLLTPDGSPLPGSTHLVGLSSRRAGKRNSINPAISFNYEALSKELNAKSLSAPESPSSSQPPTVDVGQASSHADPPLLPSREQVSAGLSRRPSRNVRAEVPTSKPVVAGSVLSRSRSRTELSPKPSTSTDPMGPPPRQNTVLERLPPRMHSLKAPGQDPEELTRRPSLLASVKGNTLGQTTFDEKDRPKPGSSLCIDVEKSRGGYGNGKRPVSPAASPAHKVDVPRGIESGTDTSDGEREPSTKERTRKLSSTKEKEAKKSRRQPVQLDPETKQSASQDGPGEDSFLSGAGDADTEDESSPVERMSRATFIAPAHPPIRFSVSENGLQELLSQFDPNDTSSINTFGEPEKSNQDAQARHSLEPDGGAASDEGRRLSSPASAATPTTFFGSSSIGDNSSVTTISAPSSQGHSDSLDQPGTANGTKSELLPQQWGVVRNASSASSKRSSSERSHDLPTSDDQRTRLDPNVTIYYTDAGLSEHSPLFTVTSPASAFARPAKLDHSAAVMKRLQDALQDTARRGMTQITLDQEFVQAVVMMIEQRRDENAKMKSRLDHIKVRPLSLTCLPSFKLTGDAGGAVIESQPAGYGWTGCSTRRVRSGAESSSRGRGRSHASAHLACWTSGTNHGVIRPGSQRGAAQTTDAGP